MTFCEVLGRVFMMCTSRRSWDQTVNTVKRRFFLNCLYRWMHLVGKFCRQVDGVQGRIHAEKPAVLPTLPSSMQVRFEFYSFWIQKYSVNIVNMFSRLCDSSRIAAISQVSRRPGTAPLRRREEWARKTCNFDLMRLRLRFWDLAQGSLCFWNRFSQNICFWRLCLKLQANARSLCAKARIIYIIEACQACCACKPLP